MKDIDTVYFGRDTIRRGIIHDVDVTVDEEAGRAVVIADVTLENGSVLKGYIVATIEDWWYSAFDTIDYAELDGFTVERILELVRADETMTRAHKALMESLVKTK